MQNKCAKYWPEGEGQIAEYGGEWKVHALGSTKTLDYMLREFLLQGTKPNFTEPRRIFHYHFQVKTVLFEYKNCSKKFFNLSVVL